MIQASHTRRFLNYIIDGLLIRLFGEWLMIYGNPMLGIRFNNFLSIWVYSLLLIFLYYTIFEGLFHRTPAKLLTRTRIVDADNGGRPKLTTIIKRTLIRFIPFEPISVAYSGWWHDEWADTWVVMND